MIQESKEIPAMIKLSIIIPYYNAEPYTGQLLDCLAPQMTDEVEVIVVDDGSSPAFDTKHDFVRVYRQDNQGVSIARNKGIDEAAGEYIQFIDADDMVPDYFVRKLLQKIEISRADVIDFSWRSYDHTGAQADVRLIEDKTFLTNPSACTRCFKRSYIGDVRFSEIKDATEDEDFSRRLGYLGQNSATFKVSMSQYMYYYRTGLPGSKSKKFQKGLKNTKRVTYYFNHVTADMRYLIDEIRKEDERNEVRLFTNQCDIPELSRWCQIFKPRKAWTHYLRGEPNNYIKIEPIPKHYDILLYAEFLNRVGGITSFLDYWSQLFKDEYKIALMCDRMEDGVVARFMRHIDVLRPNNNEPISCDTVIVNRLRDKIPGNVTYKKSIQVCHCCKVPGMSIPKNRDYLINVSEYSKQTWGSEAAGGTVIRNMVKKSKDRPLILVSATRIGAGDKGDNDKRFRILADKLNRAGISFLWFNFSDKPLGNAPRNFINLASREDVQGFMQVADYVVQLSTYEACSMTVQEALVNHVPLICCPVPSFAEQGVKDGINAHVVPFDMDFDVNILMDVPSFGYMQDIESIQEKWRKVLAAPALERKTVSVKIIKKYKDLQLGREMFPGTVFEVLRERGNYLEKELGVAEIL